MKRLIFSICVVILFSISALAQNEIHYGVYAGGSIDMMKISDKFYYDDSEINTVLTPNGYEMSYLTVNDAKIHPNGGFTIGGLFEYQIDEAFSFQFELLFNQYGYKMTGNVVTKDLADNDTQTYDYTASMKMSDLSGALIGKIHFINKLSLDFGVQPSYCFRMIKDTKRGISHKTVVYTSNKDYNPLNLTVLGGVTYYFFDNLFLSARYVYGFSDILKTRSPYLPAGSTSSDEMEMHYSEASSKASSVIFTLGVRM